MRFVFLILFFSTTTFAEKTPIKIKIDFLEALAPKDTTSSERFQKEYDGAVSSAIALSKIKLSKCGYVIEPKSVFYSASEPSEAFEKGKQSEEAGAWLLVGPRRSNHYVLLAKGAPNTPSVSTMASSDEISELGSAHLSLSPTNKEMAKVAASESARISRNKTYVVVVSEDCLSCIDFSEHFKKIAASKRLQLKKEIRISGETPDLSSALKEIQQIKPGFILLPNYSKIAALAIATFHKASPESFFVGGDGWGDNRFGFIQNASDLNGTKGFTVRGFPSPEEATKTLPLALSAKNSNNTNIQIPVSAPTLAIFKIIESTTELLCKYKPNEKGSFIKIFNKFARKYYQSHWGVSIYDLNGGDIKFQKMVSQRKQ